MLTPDQNRFFVEVGPDKPMGKLLRRYWLPFAGASELSAHATKPVRLLGEDLVAYKDLSGTYGLVDRHCPHRRADLSYGYVEACGLRCNYHGWLYDHDGKCLEQPYEDAAHGELRLKDKVRVKAYPVRECAGLLFTYMGPAPVPELPVWAPFTWTGGFREVVRSDIPCNWFQCQENSIDPVHFEWMHDNWSQRLNDSHEYAAKHLQLAFDEVDYGFAYRRIREHQEENSPLWTIGRLALWPIGFYLGEHFEWRVPVDDENTLSLSWFYAQAPADVPPYEQKIVPTWESPIVDKDGRWITSHVINQDIVAWAGQGRIADRTKEFLGASDRGILMMRRRYVEDARRIEQGLDPKGVIRDAELAKCVPLALVGRLTGSGDLTRAQWRTHPFLKLRLEGHRHCFGQPQEVRDEYLRAMGFGEEAAALTPP